uniref:NADH-ubiquinone oxidoreductase chain 5 n=1 Tax=Balanoglossus clavigerus TaxID=560604 RepID=D3H5X1_BALCL|nr:NADH dehydrogenase subunit 5 [Balanoglossus clavigerus]CBH40145.1 NADH dehydrogenase subunit 5 [Balanoglossus clavigerus]
MNLLISICLRLDSVSFSMTLPLSTIISSCFSAVLVLLILGILSPTYSRAIPIPQAQTTSSQHTLGGWLKITNSFLISSSHTSPSATAFIKWAFVISLVPSLIILPTHLSASTLEWTWLSIDAFSLHINFRYDIFSILFTSIALFITWSILEFSQYYMSTDPYVNIFSRFLTIFLMAMILLISANNLFQLLIGWEGVGFLSFLLIGWWFTRAEANTAALQAIIYNRIGDIGILLAAGYMMITHSTWTIDALFSHSDLHGLLVNPFLWGCLIAAVGKSAQFGLHPWLPAAMEGPTPVSALLHSSTMVVAGVFLLIRVSPLLPYSQTAQQATLVIGSITALFAASCAITQHDIKKIVAFSTTSQLGLMTYAVGLNLPLLAFFHICTHGFFKAMLFLCSGSAIHNTSNEQDLRKMGGLANTVPTTAACLTLGSLALFGTPFLAGFYSKDLILESASSSFTGLITLLLAMLATALTAVYSARIILAAFSQAGTLNTINPISEEQTTLTNPLKRLAAGTTIAGWALLPLLLPAHSISPTPLWLKTAALTVTLIGLIAATNLAATINSPATQISTSLLNPIRTFLTGFWHFPETMHLAQSGSWLHTGQTLTTRIFDRGWGEQVGAQGLGTINNSLSLQVQATQSGLIKQYIAIAILSLLLIALIMILFN